ncbi:MAG: threonine--tRNA ligase [Candidatus Paceibacterota bacterium]|jgi:threonyl-tRNA synthetase
MENIEQIRHSLAHLLAMVVKEKYPEAKLGLGPAIENGFYYDFDLGEKSLTDTDLDELEKKMRSLISQNLDFATETITADKACEIFAAEPYKLELIDELEKNSESISIYRSGDFVDLCAGPHVANSSDIPRDSFRLDRLAGAYWRGNENNKMLTRVYGLAFTSKPELNDFLDKRAEAEKRDHRKLGKELDLFCFSDLVGPGLPLFTPKGTIIKEELQKEVESICRHYGFEKVSAPSLAKQELFEISGHAKKFGEELFHVTSEKKHDLVLKPVQCPHHTQIYASKSRSYKDLPIRYMESDKQYRAEKTGEVSGLSRVYAITVEDGHSFCRVDQVKEEIKNMVSIIRDFYSRLGLWDEHWVSLSVRDYEHPEKYIGEPKDWDTCEQILQEVSNEMGLEAKRCEGEAALYGPKLDFMFKDATGREIQIPTVQIDFATPKRFNLEFTNEQGEKVPPVMVHRAILGSYERFLVLLIEHYAGAFPLWLSPVQAKILPISEKQMVYAKEILAELKARNIRVELDENNETLGKKIRNAKMEKIPYLLVVGDKEMESKTVTVEARGANKGESVSLAVFCAKIEEGLKSRK